MNVTATKKICFKCNFWLISILKFCSLFTYPIQVNDYISVIHCFHLLLKLWISCGTKIQNEIFSNNHFDCFTSDVSMSCWQFSQIPRAENPVKVLAHQEFYPKHQVTDLCRTISVSVSIQTNRNFGHFDFDSNFWLITGYDHFLHKLKYLYSESHFVW